MHIFICQWWNFLLFPNVKLIIIIIDCFKYIFLYIYVVRMLKHIQLLQIYTGKQINNN